MSELRCKRCHQIPACGCAEFLEKELAARAELEQEKLGCVSLQKCKEEFAAAKSQLHQANDTLSILNGELSAAKVEIESIERRERELISDILKLESENKRLREALDKFADKNNWGYFDPSGCPNGIGESVESWIRENDPVTIAQAALDGGKL